MDFEKISSRSNEKVKLFRHLSQSASFRRETVIGIDYEKKCITAGKYLLPTGDIEKDMKEIKLYFKDFKGKHPEKFTIGNID